MVSAGCVQGQYQNKSGVLFLFAWIGREKRLKMGMFVSFFCKTNKSLSFPRIRARVCLHEFAFDHRVCTTAEKINNSQHA